MNAPIRQARANDQVKRYFDAIKRFADILRPEDVVEPILAPTVQRAVYEWMTEIRCADELKKVGCRPRHTALLYGPPGTGKTTLAHHIAARFKLPLVAIASEKLIDKYLGSTGQNIGELFEILRNIESDCVVLFDEFDALAAKRRDGGGGGAVQERNQALTVMLRRIEQFRGVAIAATNSKDEIDAAMWRRFGLQIEVSLPEEDERFAILKRYGLPFEFSDDDLELLVEVTRGCSPSLLQQMMEGAKRTFVLAERLGIDVHDPVRVWANIRAAVAPPPEMEPPPLWADTYEVEKLKMTNWPPQPRKGAA